MTTGMGTRKSGSVEQLVALEIWCRKSRVEARIVRQDDSTTGYGCRCSIRGKDRIFDASKMWRFVAAERCQRNPFLIKNALRLL